MSDVMGSLKTAEELLPPPGLSCTALGGEEATGEEAEPPVTSPPGLNDCQHASRTSTAQQAGNFGDGGCAYVAGAAFRQVYGGMTATTAMPCGSWRHWFPPGFSDEAQWCKWDEGEPALVHVGKADGEIELEGPVYVTSADLKDPKAESRLLTALGGDAPQLAWPYWPEAGYHVGFDMHPSFAPDSFQNPWYTAALAHEGSWHWGERSPLGERGERGARPGRAARARTDSDLPPPRAAGAEAVEEGEVAGGRGRTQSADGLGTGGCPDVEPGRRTTVMLRNLPNNYTRAMLLALLDAEGFAGQYDFVYLPMDFKTHASLGYAFVNLVTPEQAAEFWDIFEGFSKWVVASQKVCSVSWSCPYQGLSAHIERYRNSPVMHEDVPDDYKPMVFQHGGRSTFPVPTKKLKAPRMRLCRDDGAQSVARQAEEE